MKKIFDFIPVVLVVLVVLVMGYFLISVSFDSEIFITPWVRYFSRVVGFISIITMSFHFCRFLDETIEED